MDADPMRQLEREIEILRRRYAVLVRERPAVREVPARWTATRRSLCWLVPFEEDVLEPDIDVEITEEVLIVRAPASHERIMLVGILPVPRGFDRERPVIHYFEGMLEIRIHRTGEAG
jgi:hypothetical protein